jgi:hypothetical protein
MYEFQSFCMIIMKLSPVYALYAGMNNHLLPKLNSIVLLSYAVDIFYEFDALSIKSIMFVMHNKIRTTHILLCIIH